MSVAYGAVGWNPQKKIYDAWIAGGVVLYIALFAGLTAWLNPAATIETLLIRGLGTAALLLLHIILAIGPLSRLNRKFLPLLYNRRHLGVAMFTLALAHGAFSLIQFHALGVVNPFASLLATNTRFNSLADFPFELLGLLALLILFLIAATSHDFWLHILSSAVWKRLHMMVYFAYALVVTHVLLGALQAERSPILAGTLFLGMTTLATLHWMAGAQETNKDRASQTGAGFTPVCDWSQIGEGRGKAIAVNGQRIAVFRHQGNAYALSNRCRHQGGPLGEGRIIDGCITCPWHGYQYRPQDGMSPPPFEDKVPVYETRIENCQVLVKLPKPGGPE